MVFFILLFLNNILFIKSESRNTILSYELLRIAKNNTNENTSLCLIYNFEKNIIIDLNEYEDKNDLKICNPDNVTYTTFSINNNNITFQNNQNQLFSIICGGEKNSNVINICGYQLTYLNFIFDYAHIFGNFNIVTGFIINFFQIRYPKSSLWFSIINLLLFLTEELFNTFVSQKTYISNLLWIYLLIIGIFIISLFIFKFIHKKENIICGLYICFFSYTLIKIIYYSIIKFFILRQLYILIGIIPFLIIGIIIGNKENKFNISIITTPFIGSYILIKGINYLLGGLTNEILLNKFYHYNELYKQDESSLYISTISINTYIIFYFIMTLIGFQHQFRTGKEIKEFQDNIIAKDEIIDYVVECKDNVFEISQSIMDENNSISVNDESIEVNRSSIQGES